MAKKVLIITGSPRVNGNSDLLCQNFAKGATESGNSVETVFVRDMKLNGCIACYNCSRTGKCFQEDALPEILDKIMKAEVIVLSSPVYFYSITGQMKVFLDRTLPVYEKLNGKTLYYIVTAAEDSKRQLDRAIDAFQGWADCFDNMTVAGRIYGGGAYEKGKILDKSSYQQAYEMGKNI